MIEHPVKKINHPKMYCLYNYIQFLQWSIWKIIRFLVESPSKINLPNHISRQIVPKLMVSMDLLFVDTVVFLKIISHVIQRTTTNPKHNHINFMAEGQMASLTEKENLWMKNSYLSFKSENIYRFTADQNNQISDVSCSSKCKADDRYFVRRILDYFVTFFSHIQRQ